MKSFHIRLYASILALLLCLSPLFSCAPAQNQATPPSDPSPSPITVVADGETMYTVIYAAGGESWEKGFAKRLSSVIEDATGIKLSVKKDTEVPFAEDAKEIVVGSAARSRTEGKTFDYQNGYAVYVSGSRLAFEAGSKTGAYFSLYEWARDLFDVDLESDPDALVGKQIEKIEVAGDYCKTRTLSSAYFPYLSMDDVNTKIIYNGEYLYRCMAYDLQRSLLSKYGLDLTVGKASAAALERGNCVVLNVDETMGAGEWSVTVESARILLSAGDYHGFGSAIRYVLSMPRHENGYFEIKADTADEGSYLDLLPSGDQWQTSRYAYDRRGEYRVMFNNALWGNDSGSRFDANGNKWNDVPAWDRNQLQAAMIAEYMPDVLGLQEMHRNKRGDTGTGGLIALLGALGYAEAIDPRVKNMYPEGVEIPDSAEWNGGVPTTGFGTNGGTEVTVGGETYYTYYNCVPILYNTATTEVVDAGFYWYLTQNPTASRGEKASRSITWGVFRSITTGECYIVLSTHCSGDEVAHLAQAKEARALVDKLLSQYNECPVFFGGDFNGNTGNTNYDYLVSEEGGFRSLQDWRDPTTGDTIAREYSSSTLTMHGYPRYNRDSMVMMPGKETAAVSHPTDENKNSIDQVFVDNTDCLDVQVYGVVADFCSIRSSDHLPLLVDFSIHG